MPAMFVSGYLVLLLAVAGLDRVKGEEEDVYTECFIQATCFEPGGQVRTVNCLEKMGENNQNHAIDFFNNYYSSNMTLEELIDKGCEDPEEFKKAFNEYYDERLSYERENKFTPEENEKLEDSEECIYRMVAECLYKKENGF